MGVVVVVGGEGGLGVQVDQVGGIVEVVVLRLLQLLFGKPLGFGGLVGSFWK